MESTRMLIGKTESMVGKKFNRWTVMGLSPSINQQKLILCKCDCGTERICNSYAVRNGKSKSCGCLIAETAIKNNTTHGFCNGVNEKVATEYSIWSKMKDRCLNPKNSAYSNYGGRGISVCERWLSFENFIFDMGLRPSLKHTLDRFPNNDGNYEKLNCRWATAKEQANNKRNNKYIEYNGVKMTHREWEYFLDMGQGRLRKLLHKDFKEIYDWYYPKIGLKKTSHNWVVRKNELNNLSKKVVCINSGVEYPSVCEAARQLNIGFGSIAAVCRGRSKQTQGLTFKYI